jgi:hypothetical protein
MLSAEAYERSLANRVSLNRAILTNKYWYFPVDDKGHEDFEPVGRGAKSSELCGKWQSFAVCKNVEGHKGVFIHGVDCSDKVVVAHKHWWCHKATCPVCFARGWAVRGARNIQARLEVGVKRGLGEVEHMSVSIPREDYGLPEAVLRVKSRLALSVRGVVAGCMIFHGYRLDRERGVLVWSPHYHVLGFIRGGYARCRECYRKWNCLKGCGGFDDKNHYQFLEDGYFIKVFGERITVFGTAWYQMNHSTVRVSFLKRFHAVTYFGACGNRKYSSSEFIMPAEDVCPACGGEMTKSAYRGRRKIARNVGDANYRAWFVDDELDENGEPNYVELVGSRGLDAEAG